MTAFPIISTEAKWSNEEDIDKIVTCGVIFDVSYPLNANAL
jgi:hypothetical protein